MMLGNSLSDVPIGALSFQWRCRSPRPLTLQPPRMRGKRRFYASHNETCLKLMAASQVNAADVMSVLQPLPWVGTDARRPLLTNS